MKNLTTILKTHLKCTSKEPARTNIQCTRFEFSDDCIKLISTNGHLLLISNITKVEYIEYLKEIFVNAKDVNISYIHNNIMKIMINQLINNIKYTLKSDEFADASFLDFPNYKRVIPTPPLYDMNELFSICQSGTMVNLKYLSYITELHSVMKDGCGEKESDGLKLFKNSVTYEATTKDYSFYFLVCPLRK